jgi:hypothetical protein
MFRHLITNFTQTGQDVWKVKLSLYKPIGLQEVKLPEFLDSRHVEVVRLSVVCTGHLYHHFIRGGVKHQVHSAARRIKIMKNYNDPIGN